MSMSVWGFYGILTLIDVAFPPLHWGQLSRNLRLSTTIDPPTINPPTIDPPTIDPRQLTPRQLVLYNTLYLKSQLSGG